ERTFERDGRRSFEELMRNQRLLDWGEAESYRKIDPENARLRSLISEMLDTGAWRLLWIPPSLPYYELSAPFDSEQLKGLRKRLVFSAWTAAPKAVAALTSYEAERRMLGRSTSRTTYSEARVRLKPLLRFSRSGSRALPGLPVLALMYPSSSLARLADPLAIGASSEARRSAREVRSIAEGLISTKLAPLLEGCPREGRI